MNKKIYLHNLSWTQTHENYGGVKGEFVLIDNIDYKEYEKILKRELYIIDENLQQKIDKAIELTERLIQEYKLNYGEELSKMLMAYNNLLEILKGESNDKTN